MRVSETAWLAIQAHHYANLDEPRALHLNPNDALQAVEEECGRWDDVDKRRLKLAVEARDATLAMWGIPVVIDELLCRGQVLVDSD